MVQALSQVAASLGSVLGLAISPLAKDPQLVAYYAALAGVMVVSALGYWHFFKDVDDQKTGQSEGDEAAQHGSSQHEGQEK